MSGMISANIAYFFNIGSEIHWRRFTGFRGEKPPASLVLSALAISIGCEVSIWVGAYYATPYLFRFTHAILEMWASFLPAWVPGLCCPPKPHSGGDPYERIALNDSEDDSDSDSVDFLDQPSKNPAPKSRPLLLRAFALACGIFVLALRLVRPADSRYNFYSGSLPLEVFKTSKYWLGHESVDSLPGDFSWLNGRTALDMFPTFDWLPASDASQFPEWTPFHINSTRLKAYGNGTLEHYNPLKDPLHTPNLENDILAPFQEPIRDGKVKIKHIILVKLESTRQDVWPFRLDNYIVKRIKDSRNDGKVPDAVMESLAELTPNAERLTGWETGFDTGKPRPTPYGGMSFSNAFTSGTYTLKSLTGSLCGVSPMPVESNLEYLHDIYQPCLPHIFESLNEQPNVTNADTDDWTSWPWHTMWMQSHSANWDYHYRLNPVLGFKDIMIKETIDQTDMKYIPEETEEEEHHGHEDKVLKNYLRDLVADAKKNNTRLFLGHLTHNTHNPWFKPGDYEQFLADASQGNKRNVNAYINTIRYQDEWIGDVLEVLEEAGIANETLLIMAGDQ